MTGVGISQSLVSYGACETSDVNSLDFSASTLDLRRLKYLRAIHCFLRQRINLIIWLLYNIITWSRLKWKLKTDLQFVFRHRVVA